MNQSSVARSVPLSIRFPPIAGLVVASLLVAAAILMDGSAARALNGIGAILWIASALVLVLDLRRSPSFSAIIAVVAHESLVLVLLVKPSNLVFAIAGFALGGALISLLVGVRVYDWALLLPALWLPMHLVVAICRTVIQAMTGGESSVRSDPPPTAALVPLAMVVSAMAGAWLVVKWRQREAHSSSMSA